MLVDFDANLLHKDLVGSMDSLINVARAHGVGKFVVPGSNLADSKRALDLSDANAQNNILATAGVHPYHTQSENYSDDAIEILKNLIKSNKI
jgi:Tat protein secretion system quality control protein TatD with DNase activity